MALLLLLIIVVVGLIAAAAVNSPEAKGRAGERSVRAFAASNLDERVYRRIDDITLESFGKTTQIDHVFVSVFGVFVIETKNMSGWIFGTENQAQWTQKIFSKTSRFQNPIRQNYKHVKTLEALLSLPITKFHSVVVFVGNSQFKTPMPRNVTYLGGLASYIQSFTLPVLTTQQVEQIVQSIEKAMLPATKVTTRKHVENLRTRTKNGSAGEACPKCGSRLVLRTSKSGSRSGSQFVGCSGYPRCRYTCAIT
jgi:hypothetical protein